MTVSIFVIYFSDGWRTMVNGRRGARHRFQVDAIEAALRLAAEVRRNGYAALISAQDRFGEIRPVEESQAPAFRQSAYSVERNGFERQPGDQLAAAQVST